MKYYMYISDAKVDMLSAQMFHAEAAKIATEVGIDMKVFKASRRKEIEREKDRFAKLEAVTDFLQRYGDVGSVQEPGEYFQAQPNMGWLADDESVVFGGEIDGTTVALVGSAKHIISGSYFLKTLIQAGLFCV